MSCFEALRQRAVTSNILPVTGHFKLAGSCSISGGCAASARRALHGTRQSEGFIETHFRLTKISSQGPMHQINSTLELNVSPVYTTCDIAPR